MTSASLQPHAPGIGDEACATACTEARSAPSMAETHSMLQSPSSSLPLETPRERPASRWRYTPPSRRCAFFVAVLCSLGLHSILFFGDALWPTKPPVRPTPIVEEVIQIEMPPLVDEPEVAEAQEAFGDESAEPALAPPTLADAPSVHVSLFTQPIQLAPQSLPIGQNTLRVPAGRPGSPLGKGLGTVFDLAAIDQAPTVRSHVPPDYPLALRRNGTKGSVVVEFVVDADGNVSSAEAVHSTRVEFEQPAVNAIKRWKFRPGKKAGRAVNTRVRQVVNFTLEND